MSRLATVTGLVGYNRQVFEKFERSLERWGWKEAVTNREIGHLSLKNTLVHILNVHEAWLVAIAQGRWEIFDTPGRKPDEVRSWTDLRRYRDRVWLDIDELMTHLTDPKLRRRVKAPWMPGRYTLEDAFFQASFEQAHHLGEIIGVYWQADRKPPDMTWIENLPDRSRRP